MRYSKTHHSQEPEMRDRPESSIAMAFLHSDLYGKRVYST